MVKDLVLHKNLQRVSYETPFSPGEDLTLQAAIVESKSFCENDLSSASAPELSLIGMLAGGTPARTNSSCNALKTGAFESIRTFVLDAPDLNEGALRVHNGSNKSIIDRRVL